MKKTALATILTAILCITGNVLAYDFTLAVGQNRSFTEFNAHDNWFTDDPGNPLPWPTDRIAEASGNYASVSLVASPGEAGMAYAQTGLQYDLQLGRYTWDEAKDWPLKVTVQFSYSIYAQWTLGTGSGNAWLYLPNGRLYDFIGWETGETGGRSETVTYTWDTTLEEIQTRWGGPVLVFETGCQAHASPDFSISNSSFSNVLIDSIAIEFLPRSANLSGEYWFGSLSADVSTNIPWGKRGSLVISGSNWSQEWDDNDGHHTFSSMFTTTIQPDGSINVNFPGETYNVAWNGDVMLHANNVPDSNNRLGMDIFVRKAADIQSSDIVGEYGFGGHWLGWSSRWDEAGWGDSVFNADGTGAWHMAYDNGSSDSGSFNWTLDPAEPLVNVVGRQPAFVGEGGLMFVTDAVPNDNCGLSVFVPKTSQTVTLDEIAGHYQTRFIESGPGGVPYTCERGTVVIDAAGTLSLDAYFSDGEHEVFTVDCSVGPGNMFYLGGPGGMEGIVSPDKNLIYIPEYGYNNPPVRENWDWIGGIFLIRTAEVEHNDPSARLFWYALKKDYPSGARYAIVIGLEISGTKACSFKGPHMADYASAAWYPGLDNWRLELPDLTLNELQQESLGTWELKLTHNDDQETVYSFTISGTLEEGEFLPIPVIIEPVQDANVIAQHYNLSWNPNGARAQAHDLYVEIGGDTFNYFSNIIDDAVEWQPGWLELGDAYAKVAYVGYRPYMMDGPWLISGPFIDWTTRIAGLASGDKHYFTVKYSLDFNDDDRIDLSDLAVFCSHWLETAPSSADFDDDGLVNGGDFAIFARHWFEDRVL
jgi:hypothetical protein